MSEIDLVSVQAGEDITKRQTLAAWGKAMIISHVRDCEPDHSFRDHAETTGEVEVLLVAIGVLTREGTIAMDETYQPVHV